MKTFARFFLFAALLAFGAPPVLAQQDAAQQAQSLQAQAERTRANAAEYRNNAEAYRRLSREAQEQAQRADEALALAIARGNEESRSYWERQTKFWRERMELHQREIAANEAKAAELDGTAAGLEAQAARLRATAAATPPPPPLRPPAPAPAPAAPSTPAKQPDKYRMLDLSDFVGLWRDKDNNVEGVIEGTDPKDPTIGTKVRFKGRKLTWEGELEDGGGEKPSRLVLRYKPKWQEMNEEIPDWARRKVEGQLEWKLVLQQPDDEFACVTPTLEATWHAGEVTWEGDAASGNAEVTGEGDEQKFSLDKEDDEIELHGYFGPAVLIHVGDPQRAMADPVQFLVQGQRFHVEVHMSKEAARAHSPTAGPAPAPGIGGYFFDKDYDGAPATVVFRGLKSGKTAKLDLRMAVQTRNHPVVRYETREPVTITDLWGVENKIDIEFENGEMVDASFGNARQQFRFFTSATKAKLASRDEAFQKLAILTSAILAGPGVNASHRRQADNMLALVRNARAFINDVQIFIDEGNDTHYLNDRARLAIADAYYHTIILGKHERWFGQNGVMSSPDNPFGVRWASIEELEAVFAVMKSPERTRERIDIMREGAKAGAGASIGLYTTIAYATLSIAFHATPVGEAYLAWYGEDIYGNRVDMTERISAAVGFGVSVISMTSTVAGALNAVRDANRVFAVEKAAEVESVIQASAGAVSGERRVFTGADDAARPAAASSGGARRRVARTDEGTGPSYCAPPRDVNMAELIRRASAHVDQLDESRQLARAREVHRGAEVLEAPADLRSFQQIGGECRLRSADAVEQIVRKHDVNPRFHPEAAQTRRTAIRIPNQGDARVWALQQEHGASNMQVSTWASTDLRARYFNADLPLSDVANLHESGFGITIALDMPHVRAIHQVALYSVEYGKLGRFLKRPKFFTVFDTNFPSKLFKYKACDFDRLLLRDLRAGQIRYSGESILTIESGTLHGRSQRYLDVYHFR